MCVFWLQTLLACTSYLVVCQMVWKQCVSVWVPTWGNKVKPLFLRKEKERIPLTISRWVNTEDSLYHKVILTSAEKVTFTKLCSMYFWLNFSSGKLICNYPKYFRILESMYIYIRDRNSPTSFHLWACLMKKSI